jgi:hypothetical protein
MKKIGKLSINPEKVIKNQELVNLRGGAYSCTVETSCSGGGSVKCTGDNSCSKTNWSVTCDGNTSYC